MFRILDRDGKEIASGTEQYEIEGEEANLWRDEDGNGLFAEYSSPMTRGDERPYIWKREDGSEIEIGTLIYE